MFHNTDEDKENFSLLRAAATVYLHYMSSFENILLLFNELIMNLSPIPLGELVNLDPKILDASAIMFILSPLVGDENTKNIVLPSHFYSSNAKTR